MQENKKDIFNAKSKKIKEFHKAQATIEKLKREKDEMREEIEAEKEVKSPAAKKPGRPRKQAVDKTE